MPEKAAIDSQEPDYDWPKKMKKKKIDVQKHFFKCELF